MGCPAQAASLCGAAAAAGAKGFDADFIFKAVRGSVEGKTIGAVSAGKEIARHALKTLAQAVGTVALACAGDKKLRDRTLSGYMKDMQLGAYKNADGSITCGLSVAKDGKATQDLSVQSLVVLALRCLGQIAAQADLGGCKPAVHDVRQAVLQVLELHTSQEIRGAAIDGFSGLCLRDGVDSLVSIVDSAPAVLLSRVLACLQNLLAEWASQAGGSLSLSPEQSSLIATSLLKHAGSESPAVNDAVGKCLGLLAALPGMIGEFETLLGGDGSSTEIKVTVLTSLRGAVDAGVNAQSHLHNSYFLNAQFLMFHTK